MFRSKAEGGRRCHGRTAPRRCRPRPARRLSPTGSRSTGWPPRCLPTAPAGTASRSMTRAAGCSRCASPATPAPSTRTATQTPRRRAPASCAAWQSGAGKPSPGSPTARQGADDMYDLTVFTATDADHFARVPADQVDAFLTALRDPNGLATITRSQGSVYYPTHAVHAVKVETRH